MYSLPFGAWCILHFALFIDDQPPQKRRYYSARASAAFDKSTDAAYFISFQSEWKYGVALWTLTLFQSELHSIIAEWGGRYGMVNV